MKNKIQLERLVALRKVIKSLDAKDKDIFHTYYGTGRMIMSIKLTEDFKAFNYRFECGSQPQNWDLYVYGGCGIDSKFNKTMLLNEVNRAIKYYKSVA